MIATKTIKQINGKYRFKERFKIIGRNRIIFILKSENRNLINFEGISRILWQKCDNYCDHLFYDRLRFYFETYEGLE